MPARPPLRPLVLPCVPAHLPQDLASSDLTFQPRLNPRSLRLAAAKEERELFGGGANRAQSGAAASASGSDEGPSFAPAINPASRRLLDESEQVPSDFEARQRHYARLREDKARSAAAPAGSLTFRPDTGNAVEVLALSARRSGQLLETEQVCWAAGNRCACVLGAGRRTARSPSSPPNDAGAVGPHGAGRSGSGRAAPRSG